MPTASKSAFDYFLPDRETADVKLTARPVWHCEAGTPSDDCEHRTGCETHPKELTLADLQLFADDYDSHMIEEVTAHFPPDSPLRLLIEFSEAFPHKTVTWIVDRYAHGAISSVRVQWSCL